MRKLLWTAALLCMVASPAFAQVCPIGSTCNPWETYIYGKGAASQPFAGSLKIPVVPNSTASSAQFIAANLFADLSSAQTLTSKTFTAPTINGATLSGTIAGSFTFSGVPIFSGLSSGTQTRCLGLDAGNNLVTAAGACGSGGGGGLSGMTAGQVPIAATASTVTSSKPLTGNGASIATSTGSLPSGNCVSIDGSGNFVNAGGPCTTGGGGGTVASSTIGQVPVYTAATTVTGSPNITFSSGLFTLNTNAASSFPGFASGNPQLLVVAPDTNTSRVAQITFNNANGSSFVSAAAGGTGGSPTALGSGARMGSYTFAGYDGTNLTASARMAGFALENQTPSAHGSSLVFGLTPVGTTAIADVLTLTANNLTFNSNAATSLPAFASGLPHLLLAGPDSVATKIGQITFNNASGSSTTMAAAGGTGASPTALGSGARMGTFGFAGYDGTNITSSTTMSGVAAENQTPSAHGSNLILSTTPIGSTTATPALTIGSDQNITVAGQAGSGTRCIHVDSTGKQSPTSGDCGSGGSGSVTSVTLSSPGGIFAATGTNPITTTGTFGYSTTGQSGGVPYFSSGSVVSSTATLTANLPMIGGGVGVAPSVGTRSGNTTQFVTTTGAQTSGNCVTIDGSGNHIASGSACGGSGTAALSYGTIAGGPSAYTIASPTPAVSSNVANYVVCASIPTSVTTNTGAATLAVGSAGALPLRRNTAGGALAFAGGEMVGNATGGGETQTCFKTDSTNATWVMLANPGGGTTVNPSGHAITQNEWSNNWFFLCTSACSLTMPNLATTTLSSNAGPTVVTVGVLATITSLGTDGINNGQPGGISTAGAFIVPADMSAPLFTSGAAGAGAFSTPVGPIQYFSLTFYTGQTLAAAASFGSVATPRTVVGIKCRVDTPSGVSGTVDVYTAASGTALASGTKLNTTACNLNGTANTVQDLGIASASIPVNYQIGFVPSGSIADGGTQLLQVNFR